VTVTSRHINQYIKEIMSDRFSAKDFRTWAGTLVCACTLARLNTASDETFTERKKKIVTAVKVTAEALGNTPAVCRSSYICPTVLKAFEKGKIVNNCTFSLDTYLRYQGRGLHAAERALVRFLKHSVE
jgi:DNA topoisomerase I